LPDPVEAAIAAEKNGADGIVCHLREDRRHIRDDDVKRLRKAVTTKLDLEMAATSEIVAVALRIRPDLVTLVPEHRKELTTEGGLDVVRGRSSLKKVIGRFHDRGIPVSLFIDPMKSQVDASAEAGADMIEIHTGEYADARTVAKAASCLGKISAMAKYAAGAGLTVNAGHGLDYKNTREIARIGSIEEISIGHAIVVRAMEVGFGPAVSEMVQLITTAGGAPSS